MNNLKFFIFMSLSFLCIGCFSSKVEIEYKKNINELKELLINFEKVPLQEKDLILSDGRKVTMIDTQGRINFINKTKNRWLYIGDKLAEISQKHPESKWSDDSLYCSALLYLTIDINKNSTEYTKKSISLLRQLMSKYPEIKIERWTKNFLKEVIWGSHDTFINTLLPKNVIEKEKLQLLLSYFLVIQLVKDKDYEEANKLFNQVKNRFPDSAYNHFLKEHLNSAEKRRGSNLKNTL